jgi:hypothetical protein
MSKRADTKALVILQRLLPEIREAKSGTLVVEVEAVGGVVVGKAPELVADGMTKLAREQDDPLAADVLLLLADFVRTNGGEAIEAAAENVRALIDGDPLAPMRLKQQGANALALSLLVDQLQDAGATRRKAASRLAAHVGAVLADVVSFVGREAVAALLSR